MGTFGAESCRVKEWTVLSSHQIVSVSQEVREKQTLHKSTRTTNANRHPAPLTLLYAAQEGALSLHFTLRCDTGPCTVVANVYRNISDNLPISFQMFLLLISPTGWSKEWTGLNSSMSSPSPAFMPSFTGGANEQCQDKSWAVQTGESLEPMQCRLESETCLPAYKLLPQWTLELTAPAVRTLQMERQRSTPLLMRLVCPNTKGESGEDISNGDHDAGPQGPSMQDKGQCLWEPPTAFAKIP